MTTKTLDRLDSPPPELQDWLTRSAIPLDHVEAGGNFEDLKPLATAVGVARIVSLGEATHGTREFFQLKHRFLEFLVEEMGFTTFGIEASYPDSLTMCDYVLGADIDPAEALSEMRFWTWDTEEVLALARWMREYNDRPTTVRKVTFYGYDMQAPSSSVARVVEFLSAVSRQHADIAVRGLAPLADDLHVPMYAMRDEAVHEATRACIGRLIEVFESNCSDWRGRRDPIAYERARLALATVEQGEQMFSPGADAWEVRDSAMALNIEALLDLEGEDSRLVSWAHNGHAERQSWNEGKTSMGGHLNAMFGDAHLVVGFAFNEGGFQAIDIDGGGLRDFIVGPAEHGTFDAALALPEYPVYVVDLRGAPEGPVADWFSAEQGRRQVGAIWAAEEATVVERYSRFGHDSVYSFDSPRLNFDLLCYVRSTTPARRNHVIGDRVTPTGNVDGPTNLDFSAMDPDGVPAGWAFQMGRRFPYEVAVATGSVTISRTSAPWTWGVGQLTQTIDAEAAGLRGRTVNFRVTVDVSTDSALGGAGIFVQSGGALAVLPQLVRPGAAADASVSIQVPADSDTVRLGIGAVGNTSATFSDLVISVS